MLRVPLPNVREICLDLALWGASGSPVPPPPIIKQISLASYVLASGYKHFIETGTFIGHTTSRIASLGVKVDTIELHEELHSWAITAFGNCHNVNCHHGDSTVLLPQLIADLKEPAVFWLDGHYSGEVTAMGAKITPIVEELEALKHATRRDHIVIIDDIRGFTGENDYPTVEWVQNIGRNIVAEADPLLLNDSLIIATTSQHAAAARVREEIARRFVTEAALP